MLREEDRAAESQSYMWLYRTGREPPPIVLFDYRTSRAGKHPKRFLSGFKGYLQADGYSGYDTLPDVTLVGCWAHARRKFDEALEETESSRRNSTQQQPRFQGTSMMSMPALGMPSDVARNQGVWLHEEDVS